MQKYIKPELELIELYCEDIITSSDPLDGTKNEGSKYEGYMMDNHDYDPHSTNDPNAGGNG
ncbi:MAG: hypothetical protein IIY78_01990 [Clostridia bacterium]|nr:hypothetical protein [Clostridia bacterium]